MNKILRPRIWNLLKPFESEVLHQSKTSFYFFPKVTSLAALDIKMTSPYHHAKIKMFYSTDVREIDANRTRSVETPNRTKIDANKTRTFKRPNRTYKKKPHRENEELEYNSPKHFENYKKFMSMLKMQREAPFIFAQNPIPEDPYKLNKQVRNIFQEIERKNERAKKPPFLQLGISEPLNARLAKHGIMKPLTVQTMSIPHLMAGKSAIIESETGSGKTMTYLLPIIQRMGERSMANVIIVPTRELAAQVYREALKYIADPNLVVRYVSGIHEVQERRIETALRDSSIIIGTPKRLLEIIADQPRYFREVKCIVLDEVDKLLPAKAFFKQNINKIKPTDKILSMLQHHNKRAQIIATSATISERLCEEIAAYQFRNGFLKEIRCTPRGYIHGKVPSNIQHNCVVVPDDEVETEEAQDPIFYKIRYIANAINHSGEKSVLVFISRNLSVQSVIDTFKELEIDAIAMYRHTQLPAPNVFKKFVEDFEMGIHQVVVATEETVRGMDFPFVKQMYLTYIPSSAEDYVHVAGRVGRLNQKGTVTIVVNQSEQESDKKKLKRRIRHLRIKVRSMKTRNWKPSETKPLHENV